MLSSLLIKNYALIRHLEMQPSPGLNVITGETGAGKSIMLGAIGLLMGKRADSKILLQKGQKCVVEGSFQIEKYELTALFEANDWEYDTQTTVRREISGSGKSRAFINDSPVNLDALRTLGEHLLDIHSQNDTNNLSTQQFQLMVLDLYGGNQKLLKEYQQVYVKWLDLKRKHQQTVDQAIQQQNEADYKKFLLDELESAQLDQVDQEQLEQSLQIMENAEEIKTQLMGCAQILEEGELSVSQQLSSAIQMLNKIQQFDPLYQSLKERLESTRIELKDVYQEFQELDQQVEHQPAAIEEIQAKLDTLYRLQRKHGADNVSQLIDLRDRLAEESLELMQLDQLVSQLEHQIQQLEKELQVLGQELREQREAVFPEFKERMEYLLGKLGIAEGKLDMNREALTTPGANGIDNIEWLFSANKGVQPQPIGKVASGGEFSRLMFCVKYLIADKTCLPTILFDEIDTGISGEVALQMINMMHQMSVSHQVLTISHLPQFAAKGDHHYTVYKESDDNTTSSSIRRLTGEERVEVIAKMLAGNRPSEVAYASARELMEY